MMTAEEIQRFLVEKLGDADLRGEATLLLTRLAKIEEAKAGEASFIANPKYERFLHSTKASLLIVPKTLPLDKLPSGLTVIRVSDAYLGFVYLLERFMPSRTLLDTGISEKASVHSTVSLGEGTRVGDYAVIGERCRIGKNTHIFPNTVILPDTEIGDDCILYPNVTIYHQTKIGNRVIIHSGAVIGADGFGFAPQKDGRYHKIPQVGIVRIEDDVEIGSNTTIDRATITETVIESGVKIDNLVMIAHNCRIGKNTVIAGQVGISGSTRVGEHCLLAGQVGLAGHIEVGNRITIGAQSGLAKSYLTDGESLRGSPARPMRQQLRYEAMLLKIGDLLESVKTLQEEVKALKREKDGLPSETNKV